MPRKKKDEENKEEVKEEEEEEEIGTFDREEMGEALFLQLVLGLQSSAWMHMGKIPSPMTGEMEKNLMLAKSEIDILMMLKGKTQGNLSENERITLNSSIQQLHVNFINELQRERERMAEKEAEPQEEEVEEEPKKKKGGKKK